MTFRLLKFLAAGLVFLGFRLAAQTNVTVPSQTYSSGVTNTITAGNILTTSGSVTVASGANIKFQAGSMITLLPGFKTVAGSTFSARITLNDAHFISEGVPSTGRLFDLPGDTGETLSVSIAMNNSGTQTWTSTGSYNLSSQSPPGNTTWGYSLISVGSVPITPGQTATFNFTITAPSTPGTYAFQWSMLQSGVETFGDQTPGFNIVVEAGDVNLDGLPDSYTTDTSSGGGSGIPDSVKLALGYSTTTTDSAIPGASSTFQYDQLHQITSGPGGSYTPDAEGNILTP